MIPFRSLKLQVDRQLLNTEAGVGMIIYARKVHSLQSLQQVFSTRNCVRLRLDRGDVDLARGLGLSPEELQWLAQEIDRWRSP